MKEKIMAIGKDFGMQLIDQLCDMSFVALSLKQGSGNGKKRKH